MLSDKDLDEKGKKKEQKLQLNRIGRPEWGALTLCNNSRVQQEEEKLLFFPGKDSADENPWTLFIISFPISFFPSIKVRSFPCCVGTHTCLTIVVRPQTVILC